MVIRHCLNCNKEFKTYMCQIKRGGGKFCSISCGTSYRDKINNPSKDEKTRYKISKNHADVSGINNPMYGKRGILAPSYIDGRDNYKGETYKKIAFANYKHQCAICGETEIDKLDVHHKDGDHVNNDIDNLIILCKKCHLTKVHAYLRDKSGRFAGAFLNAINL